MTTLITRLAAILALSTGMAIGGAPLPASAALASTPCAAGVPVPGDFDGDGGADLLVALSQKPYLRYDLTPSDGGPTVRLPLDLLQDLHRADLNGDTCADALTAVDHAPTLYFGTPDGLDTTSPVTLTVPHLVALPSDRRPIIQVAGIRHDGISQVVATGPIQTDGSVANAFVDLITLDATGHDVGSQSFELQELGLTGSQRYTLVADGRQIAFGSPSDTVGTAAAAGAVYLFSADTTDPTRFVFRNRLTQDSPGVPDRAEAGDNFGGALALRDGRLAIGADAERVGRVAYAGLVQPVLWVGTGSDYTAYRAIHQGTPGVVGTNETADHFGEALAVARGLTASGSYDIAIGASGENFGKGGKAVDAGSVTVANFAKAVFRTYTQNSKGVPGSAEVGDWFGSSLATLPTSPTTDSLLVGALGEDVPSCHNVGYVARTDGRRLSSRTRWTNVPSPGCVNSQRFWGIAFGA